MLSWHRRSKYWDVKGEASLRERNVFGLIFVREFRSQHWSPVVRNQAWFYGVCIGRFSFGMEVAGVRWLDGRTPAYEKRKML